MGNKRNTGIFSVLTLLAGAGVFVFGLGQALLPLLIATFLAYLLLPIVKRLEARGIRKEAALAAALGFGVLLAAVFLILLFPVLINDLKSFLRAMPRIAETAIHRLDVLSTRFGLELPLEKEFLVERARATLSEVPLGALKSLGAVFGRTFSGVAGLILSVLNLLLIPILFFHMIANYDQIASGCASFVPPRHRPWFDDFLRRSNQIVSAYFRGQLLVAVILGVLYGAGFGMVGLKFGFVIGLLTGLLNVIPYAGPLIGLGLATTVAIANFDGVGSIVEVWGVFAVVQVLEGFVITPRIVGDRVGLSALETMLILIIGGNLGGFVGMLVAIPLGGIAKVLLSQSKEQYLRSDLYRPSR